MASEVDIANLALAHLGDAATVSSFDPPEGSAQAEHCQRFYPMARDSLLEMHQWGFATTRQTLALLNMTPPASWQYVYAAPNNVLNYIAVLSVDAADDAAVGLPVEGSPLGALNSGEGIYTPQPFVVETLPDGTDVVYTNQDLAVLRYTQRITDPGQFSPLFSDALSWLLAGYLAGPVLKGEAGRQAAAVCDAQFQKRFRAATVSDANQRLLRPLMSVPWMIGR